MKSPLKVHGGKSSLATRLSALLPPHHCYVEPYAGGLSVLLAGEPEGRSEVANDLSGRLTTFWRVLQSDVTFETFRREMEATPFSEAEFEAAEQEFTDDEPVAVAINFFIRARQSLAGRMKGFAGLTKRRLRRGMNEQVSAWLSAVDGLPQVHARLRRVLVLNRDALGVIRFFDEPGVALYCDPPYLPETREATDVYEHEMTREQHVELLVALDGLKHAKFLLSGYRSGLYDDCAARYCWNRDEYGVALHSAGGDTKRRATEAVWRNF